MTAKWDRLRPAQRKLLEALAVGDVLRPGGYPSAGRDAANFDRTVNSLREAGLVIAHGWNQVITLARPCPFPTLVRQ